MAYLQGYDWDIFLSYTHSDNDLPEPRNRWVSTFRDNLAREIKAQLGAHVEIHFDASDLSMNQKLQGEIAKNLGRSALFVAVGSPSYANSQWCKIEACEFHQLYSEGRAFLAELLPLGPKQSFPEVLLNQPRATFWYENKDSDAPLSVTPDKQQYHTQLSRLARNIVQTLEELGEGAPAPLAPSSVRRAVYIAYAADDVVGKREELRKYLMSAVPGLRILPDPFLRPGTMDRYLKAVKEGLDQADIYVQLLGQNPSQPIEGLEDGDTYYQHAEAGERAKLQQFRWHPESVRPAAIDDKRYEELFVGPQVHGWSIADFAKAVAEAATRPDPPPAPKGDKPVIVISADSVDEDYAYQLFDVCKAKDFNVSHAQRANARQRKERLASADTVTFVYGEAKESWLENQHTIFMRARAERDAPLGPLPVVVCIGPPKGSQKRIHFHTQGMREIDVRDEWSVEPFKQLLDEMSPP